MPPYMSSPLTVGPPSPEVEQLSASGSMARGARLPHKPRQGAVSPGVDRTMCRSVGAPIAHGGGAPRTMYGKAPTRIYFGFF